MGTAEEIGLLWWSSVCLIFKNPPKVFTVKTGLRVHGAKGLLSLGSTIPQRQTEGGKRGVKEGGNVRDRQEMKKDIFVLHCAKIPSLSYDLLAAGELAAPLYHVCGKSRGARDPEPAIREQLDPDQTIATR